MLFSLLLYGASWRPPTGHGGRRGRPRGRDPRPPPPGEGPEAQGRPREALALGQSVPRRSLTRPPQGALVKLRRHAGHPAPLASRARTSQVDLTRPSERGDRPSILSYASS